MYPPSTIDETVLVNTFRKFSSLWVLEIFLGLLDVRASGGKVSKITTDDSVDDHFRQRPLTFEA